jgi:hypothetical protein
MQHPPEKTGKTHLPEGRGKKNSGLPESYENLMVFEIFRVQKIGNTVRFFKIRATSHLKVFARPLVFPCFLGLLHFNWNSS